MQKQDTNDGGGADTRHMILAASSRNHEHVQLDHAHGRCSSSKYLNDDGGNVLVDGPV